MTWTCGWAPLSSRAWPDSSGPSASTTCATASSRTASWRTPRSGWAWARSWSRARQARRAKTRRQTHQPRPLTTCWSIRTSSTSASGSLNSHHPFDDIYPELDFFLRESNPCRSGSWVDTKALHQSFHFFNEYQMGCIFPSRHLFLKTQLCNSLLAVKMQKQPSFNSRSVLRKKYKNVSKRKRSSNLPSEESLTTRRTVEGVREHW